MIYLNTIKRLVNDIPRATGCILVDIHGEEIMMHVTDDEYQMRLLGAYMVPILQRLESIAKRMGSETNSEVLIRTETTYIMTAPIGDGNYLVLRLEPTPLITPSIERLRKAVKDIIEDG